MQKKFIILLILSFSCLHYLNASKELVDEKPKHKTVYKPIKKSAKKKVDPEEKENKALMRKKPKDMSIPELMKAKDYAIKIKRLEFAIDCIKQILLTEQNQETARQLRLQLADVYFENNQMKEAARAYRHYIKFYPGSSKDDLEYAKYKEILCRFYMCLKPPLDQTKTYRTLTLTNEYLEQAGSLYALEVKDIQSNCYDYIFKYESDIILFNAKDNLPTENRITDLKKQFKPAGQEFAMKLLDLEIAVAEMQNKTTLLAEKKAERAEKFPQTTQLLAQNKPKPNYRDIF